MPRIVVIAAAVLLTIVVAAIGVAAFVYIRRQNRQENDKTYFPEVEERMQEN